MSDGVLHELLWYGGILAMGVVAGIVNTMVGAGTTLTLPLLVLVFGLPDQIANATNRLAVVVQALAGTDTLRRARAGSLRDAIACAVAAGLGALPGSYLASVLEGADFSTIMAWVLLAGVAMMFIAPARPPTIRSNVSGVRRAASWLTAFLFGLYGGFLGAGIGVLIMMVLPRLLGISLLNAVVVKTLMVLVLSASASVVFVWQGQVYWTCVVPLAIGNGFGGVIGARLAIDRKSVV